MRSSGEIALPQQVIRLGNVHIVLGDPLLKVGPLEPLQATIREINRGWSRGMRDTCMSVHGRLITGKPRVLSKPSSLITTVGMTCTSSSSRLVVEGEKSLTLQRLRRAPGVTASQLLEDGAR